MNEQAYKYVGELIHELYEEKLKVHRYRYTLEEIREIAQKETSHYDRLIEIVTKVGEVLE